MKLQNQIELNKTITETKLEKMSFLSKTNSENENRILDLEQKN